jgi:hypothetical protein
MYDQLPLVPTLKRSSSFSSEPHSHWNSVTVWVAILLVAAGVATSLVLLLRSSSSSPTPTSTESGVVSYISTVSVNPSAGTILAYTAAGAVEGAVDVSMNVTIPSNFSETSANFTLRVVSGAAVIGCYNALMRTCCFVDPRR